MWKKCGMAIAIAAGVLAMTVSTVESHSGGLDRYGCHAGSRPYHCHRDPPVFFDRNTRITEQQRASIPKEVCRVTGQGVDGRIVRTIERPSGYRYYVECFGKKRSAPLRGGIRRPATGRKGDEEGDGGCGRDGHVDAGGGCASITKDEATLVQVNAEGCPEETECTLKNKKGSWKVKPPGSVAVRRSDDALRVSCSAPDGGAVGEGLSESEIGGAFWVNLLWWPGMVVDAHTDKHRDYGNVVTVNCN